MSRESLIKAYTWEDKRGNYHRNDERINKLIRICHALNFAKQSGVKDINGKPTYDHCYDMTFYHGYKLRDIAGMLNIKKTPGSH